MGHDLCGKNFNVAEKRARGVVVEHGHGRSTKRSTFFGPPGYRLTIGFQHSMILTHISACRSRCVRVMTLLLLLDIIYTASQIRRYNVIVTLTHALYTYTLPQMTSTTHVQ